MNPNDDKSVNDYYADPSLYTIHDEVVFHATRPTESEPKPKRHTSCIECGYDMLACTCNECECSYCTRMNCSCQSDPEEDEHSVGSKRRTLDDVDDELIAKSSVPNLGALFKSAKQSGLISQTAGYN